MWQSAATEIDGVPERRLDLHLHALLYHTHPYRVPVLGWPEEVARLTPQDVMTFHHTWYAPNNALLIVAGDITTVTARAPGATSTTAVSPRVTCPPGSVRVSLRSPARPWLVMQEPHLRTPVWHAELSCAELSCRGDASMRMPSTSLARSWQVRRHVASLVLWWDRNAWPRPLHVDYMPDSLGVTEFTLHTTPAPGVEIEVLEQAIDQALAEVVARSVSPTDVRQAQQRLRCQPPLARHTCPGRGRHPGDGVNHGAYPGRRWRVGRLYCGSHPEPGARSGAGRAAGGAVCHWRAAARRRRERHWDCAAAQEEARKETPQEDAGTHAGAEQAHRTRVRLGHETTIPEEMSRHSRELLQV